ncbi:unnamed protein product, partial [Prorocentrum cordatum]
DHDIPSEPEYAQQMFGGDGPSLWPRDGSQSTFFKQNGIDVRPVPDQEFVQDRQKLLGELKAEIAELSNHNIMRSGEDPSCERMDQVLTQFFNGGLVGRLHELRKTSPDEAKEIEAEDELPEDAQRDKELWEELQKNNYYFNTSTGAGNPAGSRWQRALKASEKLRRKCAKCHGYHDSQKFRARWAKRMHRDWKCKWTRTHSTTLTKAQMKDGEYCSIGRIAKKEGGGLHGMQLAFKYCTNAIILGGMWAKWDDMTESIKFLYFTHRMSETFKEAWE